MSGGAAAVFPGFALSHAAHREKELFHVSTTSAAAGAGMAYRARVGLIANALTVESGGKSTVLAGGMDETTAYGLLADVGKVLGFNMKEFAA